MLPNNVQCLAICFRVRYFDVNASFSTFDLLPVIVLRPVLIPWIKIVEESVNTGFKL